MIDSVKKTKDLSFFTLDKRHGARKSPVIMEITLEPVDLARVSARRVLTDAKLSNEYTSVIWMTVNLASSGAQGVACQVSSDADTLST
jgi:hypothetical protein